jgi:glutathione synthase/RimK-type ligase-like ATP-grasp enzyme
MTQNKIVFLTGYDRFFGQTRKPWVSMDADKIINIVTENGYQVAEYGFHEIVNKNIPIRDSIVFYTFSQRENLRRYIMDAIRCLDDGTNLIIPSYDLLCCHENKGYQEIIRKKLNILEPKGLYFSSKREISNYNINYPVVLKDIEGSNAKGVFRANNFSELLRIIRKIEPPIKFLLKLDLFRRKYFRRKKHYSEYKNYNNRIDCNQYRDYIIQEKRFVLQEFIPGLSYDYRMIIFYNHYYVVRRKNRDADFRASGAKRFIIDDEVDSKILDYAREIFSKFNNPYLSIDIGCTGNHFVLFEFQALHFGINAIVKNSGYYTFENGVWKFHKKPLPIEAEIAMGLVKFLQDNQ